MATISIFEKFKSNLNWLQQQGVQILCTSDQFARLGEAYYDEAEDLYLCKEEYNDQYAAHNVNPQALLTMVNAMNNYLEQLAKYEHYVQFEEEQDYYISGLYTSNNIVYYEYKEL